MEKITVAVFFGGCSPEYSVSLQSAAAVLEALPPEGYKAVAVGITPVRSVKKSNPGSGVWLLFCVWGFAGIAGGRFIIKAGESFGCVQHVNIGNLFAAADIVKHDNPIVIQVHGIYKRVDNPPPKFHVEQVPLAERFQPYDNIRFSVADFVCNAQL